ncbi:hypothetical protein GGR51DRAFT_578312 [Nemania sp. FL0031]|nr:hypothetical protein GGR51DRAFT_578312 [Nemania sp. FL0031]
MGTKRKADYDDELLKKGSFSDITVKCGERTWDLHRAILVPRCGYFRAALEDNKFKEAQERLVEIHDQDPNHVNWVIQYIYTETMPRDLGVLFADEQAVMNACIDLFTIADYFTLDELCNRACQILADHLVGRAAKVYGELYPHISYEYQNKEEVAEILRENVDQEFLERFFSAVKRVYSIGSGSFLLLKSALLLYPSLTLCTTLREDVFGDTIFKDPELAGFAVDILKAVFGTGSASKLLCKVEKCAVCGKDTAGHVKFAVKRQDDGYTIDAWCRICAGRKFAPMPRPNISLPDSKRRRTSSAKKPRPIPPNPAAQMPPTDITRPHQSNTCRYPNCTDPAGICRRQTFNIVRLRYLDNNSEPDSPAR